MRAKLTEAFVEKTKAATDAERTIFWDTEIRGFGLVVTSAGHRSFVVQYRVGRRSRRMSFKSGLSLADARREAKAALGAVAKDRDPLAERRKIEATAEGTLRIIAETYLAREKKSLRSIGQRRAVLERVVYPRLGARQINEITRTDIVRLLDKVEDGSGPVAADMTLAIVRRLFTWYASRSDTFCSPIVRGMSRSKPRERRRKRVLSDDELRSVWKAAESSQNAFGFLLRFLLITATRRNEAARMRRSEIVDISWTIPAERHKSKENFLLPLSMTARAFLNEVPIIGHRNDGPVFTTDGKVPIAGFSKFKKTFDKRCPIAPWRMHDLRRTARSLMSRAGVSPDHAERATGHVIPGIRGTYDLFEYFDEKLAALEALALQIERILQPPENIVALRAS
jgi:integrase